MRAFLISIILIICIFPVTVFGIECIRGDCFNGQGAALLPNGDRYEGQFQDGLINGKGIYTFSDGKKYVGEFKDGQPHGEGVMDFTDGSRWMGTFKNGTHTGKP